MGKIYPSIWILIEWKNIMRQFYQLFPNWHTVCAELNWSHYRLLMRIDNEERRIFYQEECVKSRWSVRQLHRQINTMYYDRILAEEINQVEPKPEYETIIKDPYILEFLNLEVDSHYYERDLEKAIIDHLQKFLLELGEDFV